MFTRFCVLLLLCLNFIACSDFKKTESKITLQPGEEFSVELRGLDQPNTFEAAISFKGQNDYVVQKSSSDQKVTSFALSSARAQQTDSDLNVGETYTYSIGKTEDGEFKSAKSVSLTILPDFVVEGKESFPRTSDFNHFRIYLKKDSSLRTLGQDISINVEEIFSEVNGKIETFSVDDTAPNSIAGLPSGNLVLRTKKIKGPLTIAIRGQTGGKGIKGMTGAKGLPGIPSLRRDSSSWIFSAYPYVCNEYWYGLNKDRWCPDLNYDDCRSKYHPGVGGKGETGGYGLEGLQGAPVGLTQKTYLEIPEASEVKIVFEAGHGGIGGDGGDGGPGGDGGSGGKVYDQAGGSPCTDGPNGPNGDLGGSGPRGKNGINGEIEQLYVNGELR